MIIIFCPTCDSKDVSFEKTDSGIVYTCNKCGTVDSCFINKKIINGVEVKE